MKKTVRALLMAALLTAGCGGRTESAPCLPPTPLAREPSPRVQLAMKGVRFHATDTVIIEIEWLRGELLPTHEGRPPDTEDPSSYVIRLDAARIRIPEESIAADFRDWVLAGSGAPVEALRVRAKDGRLRLTGRISPGVPFEITTRAERTNDGMLRVQATKIEATGIGVRGLSEKTGIDLRRVIGTHEERGVRVEGNDMLIDAGRAFPPPNLDGPLESARVVDGALELVFGRSPKLSAAGRERLPDPGAAHYIQHWRGALASGKVVVYGADQRLLDADPTDPFDYSQPRFSRVQLPVSRIHVSPGGGTTTMHVPDFDEAEKRRVRGRE